MTYAVTLASYPICNLPPDTVGPIPGTEHRIVMDTTVNIGKTIWHGYLQMREEQKRTPAVGWSKILLTEKDSELEKFREAVNLFFRFLAGEGTDNCKRVQLIEVMEGV